ncbi:hypothetical protein [Thermoleptolyngbya sp. C42_A2020_037]|uniref:hypothetical protein n=1 Tax=Thermoleptolyngbya sp. C42_A2020_037 TaxID=2747799 RepID=UPI0019EA707B|nr:hypothetical protein [Thermoleptolyngbya sp. C42_A2020_037]MBF2085290.1 hypothetical protein [Thermoleptolyngbya sp. C42_A2020_037]
MSPARWTAKLPTTHRYAQRREPIAKVTPSAMTQEPPPPPNSPNNPPEPPEKPPTNVEPGYGPPSLQDLRAEYVGLGKRLLIGLLRANVRLLEGWIAALEAPPRRAQTSLGDRSPGELAAADSSALVRTEPGAPPVPVAPSLGRRLRTAIQQVWATVQPAARQVWAVAKPYWEKGWAWWTANALPKIRAILPTSIRDALADRALSGAIAGIAALLVFVVPNLLPSQEPTRITEPPLISEAPVDGRRVEQPLPRVTTIPEVVPDDLPPAPAPAPSPDDSPRPSRPTAKPQPTPPPQPSPLPTPATPTTPARPALPDQPLVAAIQEQITSVTDAYSENLIQTIQASFRSGRLRVNLGDGWYALSPASQDKLAAELLKRATRLDFTKLELVAPDGTLLARSPVVGDRMIILKRSLQPEQAA